MATVSFEDFSGGLTDYPMNAGKNKCKRLDNVILRQYEGGGKPFTRQGSELLSKISPQLPSGQQRVGCIFYHSKQLFCQSGQHLYYLANDEWREIKGPTGNNAFPEATPLSTFTYSRWGSHILLTHTNYAKPSKLYIDNNEMPQILTAGLPTPTILNASPVFMGKLCKVVFSHTYITQGGVEFEDVSHPTLPVYKNDFTIEIAGLPSNYNYPMQSAIKAQVYCTTTNGTTYYLLAEQYLPASGNAIIALPFIDDDVLTTNPVLYTDGGILGNSEPPRSNSVHIVDEVAYYGAVIDIRTGGEYRNRVMTSIPADIDSVPESFYLDLDDDIVTISSTNSTILALCKRGGVYRLSNTQNELGQGSLLAEKISNTATCISAGGVVQTLYGVFWAGHDGIYHSDGYTVKKLNQEFDYTYRQWTLTDKGDIDDSRVYKIQGKYNQQDNTIGWVFQSAAEDNDILYLLDLKYGIRENSAFTTWTGGTSFRPSAIEYISGDLIRGDSRGFIFRHKNKIYTDPVINLDLLPSKWPTQTIIYDISTIDYDFQTSETRKYVTEVTVACASFTNLSLQIISNSDMGRKIEKLSPVRSKSSYEWGADTLYWGDPYYFWNTGGSIHHKRKMPGRSLRCNYKSLTFTNAKVAMLSSDEIGSAKIDATAKTLVLNQLGMLFPPSFVGYFVALENDNYDLEFEIESVSDDRSTLILKDPANQLISTDISLWVVRGYPKGEVLNLLNVIINYEPFGKTQGVYRSVQSGEVGN